ncbi:MAG: hypothetical protein PV340_01750 [Wolbachia sp.]|nr:hypothetical protein [Wolbachia sp.]MDD9336450.1 hypothetical protein [Wolbachia sp.]
MIKNPQKNYNPEIEGKQHGSRGNKDIALMESSISSELGLNVKISDNNSKGKVTIQYNNPTEFKLIVKILSREIDMYVE